MTKEERKKAYRKAYYLANKEKNKERIIAYKKAYYIANKERITADVKAYNLANKENKKAYYKEYYLGWKHKPLVYLLPKCNWVGTTECIRSRIYKHISLGRNTDNYKILKKFETRAEALDFERKMHDLGYQGRHKNNAYR